MSLKKRPKTWRLLMHRGHEVLLCESGTRLGGQLPLAAAPPGRGEFAELARDLARQLAVRNVRVCMEQTVDPAFISAQQPDAVVLATGARSTVPPIDGVDLPHVRQAWDVLEGKAYTGRRVAVVGGGAVGVETALYLADRGTLSGEALKFLLLNRAESVDDLYRLASRGTKEVVLVEMVDRIGADIGKSTRWAMLQHLERSGVAVRTACRVLEITPRGIRVDAGEGPEEIGADSVVLAAGAAPYNPLQPVVEEMGIDCVVVGDAGGLGKAFDAVHQGFDAGRAI